MKRKSGFVTREVGGKQVAVAVGERSKDFNGMLTLNGCAAFLWQLLETEQTKESLLSALLSEYDIDEATAAADLSAFLDKLRSAALLDE